MVTAKLTNLWPSFLDRIGIWSVGFFVGGKTGESGEKPSEQGREPTLNSPHVMPGPAIEPRPQRWEASALTPRHLCIPNTSTPTILRNPSRTTHYGIVQTPFFFRVSRWTASMAGLTTESWAKTERRTDNKSEIKFGKKFGQNLLWPYVHNGKLSTQ